MQPLGATQQQLGTFGHKDEKNVSGPAPLSLFSPGQELWLLHIPKTGIASLCEELKLRNQWRHPDHEHCQGAATNSHTLEKCLTDVRHEGAFHVTLLREPRAHVLSQYSECRFDFDWHPTLKGIPGCPERPLRDCPQTFSANDFHEWLQHFVNGWTLEDGMYHCYNPWNHQARTLTCSHNDPHKVMSMDQRVPNADDATKHLAAIEMVGITELYDESWCVLMYQLHNALPETCSCGSFEKPEDEKSRAREAYEDQSSRRNHSLSTAHRSETALWHEGELRIVHNVPRYPPPTELNSSALDKIDRLTKSDRAVYAAAVTRLLSDLCALQQLTATQVVCQSRLQRLHDKTSHISSLWQTDRFVKNDCAHGSVAAILEHGDIVGQEHRNASQ